MNEDGSMAKGQALWLISHNKHKLKIGKIEDLNIVSIKKREIN